MKKLLFITLLAIIGLSSAYAQTNVSGGIYSNTTWTKANSPYIVDSEIVVFPGVTLTIEPGVVVKFDSAVQLVIRQATLIAQGTAADSITFTANSALPSLGFWSSIYFVSCSDTMKFNYCNINYSEYGIFAGNKMIINNSNFNYNSNGIYEGSSASINLCNFSNNNNGIWGNGSYNIRYCNFFNNQYGINSINGSLIKNCIFRSNQTGMEDQDGNNSIKNCTIDSNSIYGINLSMSQQDSVVNCQIEYNGTGIYGDEGFPQPSFIIMNDIEYNTIGIEVEEGQDTIHAIYCNKFCNNTSYDFYYNANQGSNISIPDNYWCTTDSTIIETHIYDGYDNINKGLVFFMPIDTSHCYLTGCNLSVSAIVTNATCDTCNNGSATGQVTNGFPPYTWTWYTSPIQTTQTATGLKPGTYTLCVTDSKGCSFCNHSIFIDSTNCTGFAITTYSSNATCSACNDGSASVVVTGGTPPYNYTWYTIPMQSTSTATGLTHGTYHVCVTDLYGCTECDSATVSTGNCSAYFYLYADTTTLHHYYAVNMVSGVPPISYYWSWGDGTHDTVAYPNHTFATAGFYTICLTITDSADCTNTHCDSFYLQRTTNTMITVDVIPNTVTGINEINSKRSNLELFPNPANDIITVEYSSFAKGETISVYDIQGQLLLQQPMQKAKTNIDISAWVKGVYFIKVKTANGMEVSKIVKE